ncbi:MAG: hypothetical protein B7Y80_01740 [Hyphomicrobium sp. 32-62-53]|nr:MAG: hypothetical protein B7Z29_02090 [Hyphomicrobium sp. 12-62-95]OYY01476.1 MAG: hypothetical protein B7Y80_01740 [Hyphomicrobium sp. 32-62-53]
MMTSPLSETDLEKIKAEYDQARARRDISALAILAVEAMPVLIADLRLLKAQADQKREAA